MFYTIHDGSKKTPLHIFTGITVHNACKSKILIKIFNRLGVSISYDEVLRCRTNLALLTIELSKNNVPIPLHFDKNKYTTAAFDNFDHDECTLSGQNNTHDSVTVLFQEKSSNIQEKINKSLTSVDIKQKSLNVELTCQQLESFYKPIQKISLPENFVKKKVSFTAESYKVINPEDLSWILSRMSSENFLFLKSKDEKQVSPMWSSFNSVVCFDERLLQIVGFFPILSYPVTEYATVYTALCNFLDILNQLEQKELPVFCNEGILIPLMGG